MLTKCFIYLTAFMKQSKRDRNVELSRCFDSAVVMLQRCAWRIELVLGRFACLTGITQCLFPHASLISMICQFSQPRIVCWVGHFLQRFGNLPMQGAAFSYQQMGVNRLPGKRVAKEKMFG